MKNKVYPLSPLPPPPPRRKAAEVVLDRALLHQDLHTLGHHLAGIVDRHLQTPVMELLWINAYFPVGTCVRVLRNVEQSDFPDIDQMLQDLQGLPSPDDPLYEVSLSHG